MKILLAFILLFCASIKAVDYTFHWNPSPHPNIIGYQFRVAPVYFTNSTGINGYWVAPKYTRATDVTGTNITVTLGYTNFFAVVNQVLNDGTVIPYTEPILVRVPPNSSGFHLIE